MTVQNKIRNMDRLLAAGDKAGRKIVLGIVEEVLDHLDSRRVIRNTLKWDGRHLTIGKLRWDLSKKHRVIVVGAGKAGNAMASGVEETLGERITEGLVIVKAINPEERLARVELVEGGHPLPDERLGSQSPYPASGGSDWPRGSGFRPDQRRKLRSDELSCSRHFSR